MIDEKFSNLKDNVKFYKISLNKNTGKFTKIKISKNTFETSWIIRGWLNYDILTKNDDIYMFCTENKIKEHKRKIVRFAIEEQQEIIKKANRITVRLSNIC